MKTEYTYAVTPAEKVTVTISREQMWKNFIESWRDVAWDNYNGTSAVKEVADALLIGEPLAFGKNAYALRKLFRDGYTVMLMNDAMSVLDNGRDILREIVVTDGENENVVVYHRDIIF